MFNYNPWMYYSHTNGEGELDLVLKSYDKDWTKCQRNVNYPTFIVYPHNQEDLYVDKEEKTNIHFDNEYRHPYGLQKVRGKW